MKLTGIIIAFLLLAGMVSAGSIDSLYSKGNNFYQQKQYSNALLCYETILKTGKVSADLYYNLANSYFKTGENTSAILYYEKALKLKPEFEDATYNLAIANSRITDKIESLPELFFITWFKDIRNTLNANTWSIVSLSAFAILLLTVLGFLLLQSILLRKISAAIAFFSLFAFIIFVVFAISSHYARTDKSKAILTAPSVIAKSSPDESATDLFVIHEGTKVTIRETFEDWCEIQIADGNRGWVTSDRFSVI